MLQIILQVIVAKTASNVLYGWNFSYNVSECGSKICDGSRSLRNIHDRSACTGRRKKKQEEDERWERQKRRITMDHLLDSPSLDTRDTTDTIGYSLGPLLKPVILPDRFRNRSDPVISDYRWMQTLLSVSKSSLLCRKFFTRLRCKNYCES